MRGKNLTVLLILISFSAPALAYLDPVTGSLIIQGLIALVVSVIAGVKSIRNRIVALFNRIFRRN
jgi:hypothetical protein